jgi:hypothetical protein
LLGLPRVMSWRHATQATRRVSLAALDALLIAEQAAS